MRLEQPMTTGVQAEARPAQHDRVAQRGADDVLDHERQPRLDEECSRLIDEVRVVVDPGSSSSLLFGDRAVRLARRAGVDRVEPVERERERVRLVELERVAWLRVEVDADDVESGAVVADRAAAGAAEQVEQPRPHADAPIVAVIAARLLRECGRDAAQVPLTGGFCCARIRGSSHPKTPVLAGFRGRIRGFGGLAEPVETAGENPSIHRGLSRDIRTRSRGRASGSVPRP